MGLKYLALTSYVVADMVHAPSDDKTGTTRQSAQRTLQTAINYTWRQQQSDGHWVAPVSADATFTAQYVMFKYAIPGLSLASDAAPLRQWLLGDQNPDGSWGLAPGMPGNVSTSVEAYLALRLLDVSTSHPAMERAKSFIRGEGGIAKVRFFTRFFLATFGLVPWAAVPQMPVELILMPTWAKLNIYVLSSWARSTLIPVLVVRHHQPVYALPNGRSADNDFLDELWCDPRNKHVPFTRSFRELVWGPERDVVELLFTVADLVLVRLGGLRRWPPRTLAIRRCIEWLLEHQEAEGDWAGFFPPMHGSVWALILEGFPLHHKAVSLGLEAIERLANNDAKGKWLQSTVSPCWDTALMLNALCDAGCGDDPRVAKAVGWLKARQLMVPHGDWRIYANTQQAGGWSFEYYNSFYPDVDDTAVVVMALVKQDPYSIQSACIENAVEWILGMQNRDGGWGAFDINNDARWLHKIPFSDMDSLVDPSTSDVTGRMLECFGVLLAHRKGVCLRPRLRYRLQAASKRALEFLFKEQETMTAAAGAWWGRWGNNYNYGTANVLRGLAEFAHDDPRVRKAVGRAIRWLGATQNEDGGWGEDLLSYKDRSLAGRGASTAAQTAWAVDALLRYRPPSDPAAESGIQWLASNQNAESEACHGATWPNAMYVGTGFPNVLYLGYPFYHHLFPMQALSRYLDDGSTHQDVETTASSMQLTAHTLSTLQRPSALFMVLGSRGDIDVFLSVAKRLHGYRIRIATHPAHRALVQSHGFDFYDVGGSPDEFARLLRDHPNVLLSCVNGSLAALRRSLCLMFQRFWRASYDDDDDDDGTALELVGDMKKSDAQTRPFVADVIVSSPATAVHISAAEKLCVPLVMVSIQPILPTPDFPHVFTMTEPKYGPGRWWNMASYYCLEIIKYLAFSPFLNRLRMHDYSLLPTPFLRATTHPFPPSTPYLHLFSPSLLPTPHSWPASAQIVGFTSAPPPSPPYNPPVPLQTFLSHHSDNPNHPLLAISFGSMSIPNPAFLLASLSSALAQVHASAVISRSWPASLDSHIPSLTFPNLYIADAIPHDCLLPQVRGFIHHGGAGHTAAGLKAGVPQLLMPFLLDQFFWAARVEALRLGPKPLRFCDMTVLKLVQRLRLLFSGIYQDACEDMVRKVRSEGDGGDFVRDVVKREMEGKGRNGERCAIFEKLGASWRHVDSGLVLSGMAAAALVEHEDLAWGDLAMSGRNDGQDRWEGAEMPKGRIGAFATVIALAHLVLETVYTLLRWLGGFGDRVTSTEEDRDAIRQRDPVRKARIRQAQYDWQLARQESREHGAAGLAERLAARWRASTAATFRARFAEEGEEEVAG